jgi:hypothetical protein
LPTQSNDELSFIILILLRAIKLSSVCERELTSEWIVCESLYSDLIGAILLAEGERKAGRSFLL